MRSSSIPHHARGLGHTLGKLTADTCEHIELLAAA